MRSSLFKIILFLSALLVFSPDVLAQEKLLVIVSPDVTTSEISVSDVEAYFLKKKLFWPDKSPVRPIGWIEGTPARKIFLKNVLHKSTSEIAQYWIAQKLSTGRSSPLKLNSAKSICDLLQSMEGGISYIVPEDHIDSCLNLKILAEIE